MSNEQTVNALRLEVSSLLGRIATLTGEPLLIWDGMSGDVNDIPAEPGFLLHVEWAIRDQSQTAWFSTIGAAKAALLGIAQQHQCVPSASGMSVDLTSPGCQSSRAYITGTKVPEGQLSPRADAVRVALYAALEKRKLREGMDDGNIFGMAREIGTALEAAGW